MLESASLRALRATVVDDWHANGRSWSKPGLQALVVHRFGAWVRQLRSPARLPLTWLYTLLYTFVRNCYGVELPWNASIGRRLVLPHGLGVVVSGQAVIGDDCMIRQNVTIGQFNRGRRRTPPYAPTIGDGVQIGPGAVILGGITIGAGARIGPNAVVMTDVEPGASASAHPARIMAPLAKKQAQAAGGSGA